MKILWLSDSPFSTTGFSSQSLFLMNGLADKGHEIHYQAHNFQGQTLLKDSVKLSDGTPLKFKLYGSGKEMYSKDLLQQRCKDIKPDFFGVLLDTFMLYPWYIEQDYSPAMTTWWFPSDGGGGLPLGCEHMLKKCNVPVAMAKFGQRQAQAVHGLQTNHIPHGVNTELFRPLPKEERDAIKAKWGVSGKFVVGSVARNQGRKMMDRTIKAFYYLNKLNPNTILVLHTDPYDAAAGFDINVLITRLKLNNKIIFTGMKFFNTFTYKDMNEIYNLFDVFMLSTSGEGFGVPIIEAMSAGIPVVCTDYTTTRELIIENGQCGEAVKLVGTDILEDDYYSNEADAQMSNGTITGSWCVERGLIDVKDCAERLQKLAVNPDLVKQYSTIAREKALKYYDFRVVVEQWHDLLTKIKGEY